MDSRKFGQTWVLKLEPDDEVVASLTTLAREQNIRLATVQGIGATDQATVGVFEPATRNYRSREITGDHEITSLAGNITTRDGEVYLHLHVTLSDGRDHTVGGHLNAARISAAGEVFVTVLEGSVGRRFDDGVGLNVLDFD